MQLAASLHESAHVPWSTGNRDHCIYSRSGTGRTWCLCRCLLYAATMNVSPLTDMVHRHLDHSQRLNSTVCSACLHQRPYRLGQAFCGGFCSGLLSLTILTRPHPSCAKPSLLLSKHSSKALMLVGRLMSLSSLIRG